MLLSILQCTGSPHNQESSGSEMSIVQQLRNPAANDQIRRDCFSQRPIKTKIKTIEVFCITVGLGHRSIGHQDWNAHYWSPSPNSSLYNRDPASPERGVNNGWARTRSQTPNSQAIPKAFPTSFSKCQQLSPPFTPSCRFGPALD